ncbi:hypothetical protein CLV28_0298 [Sediminihabitans luteus]|uniref:Uncharacterized protein n=1 Tax=Sediminihabitans luteus TaxID=1138585 RepID=A0A2M9CZ20_9CELL|nr:PPA1309 family protein [Sediminihabitans luteus]PJJ77085.1 hypothetical protein CLV28_0298 [Sediminihabitans luteus]GIJ00396.1 hypothetical protein Slu03_27730 [Sediminihabitans luteus]
MEPDATPPAPSPEPAFSAAQVALADAVREIEQHVATAGWDAPVRLFALVETSQALDADPTLADRLPPEVVATARAEPRHLTSVEQELDPTDDLEALLGRIGWPPAVAGAAVVVERIVLPPEAEDDVPAEHEAALEHLANHPDRQDVRIAAGVLREGSTWCALRSRSHDADDQVAFGPDLVPGLTEALRATFED